MAEPEEPIVTAIAMALYAYNVSAAERAQLLYDHFDGACAEVDDLYEILRDHSAHAATEFIYPTAEVYVQQAMGRYGDEARATVMLNRTVAKPWEEPGE